MRKNLNILLLSIYSGDRSAYHVEGLHRLESINDIYLIESNKEKGYPYPFEIDSKIKEKKERDLEEGNESDPETLKRYLEDIKKFIKNKKIDFVIPTSDAGVYAASLIFPKKKTFAPNIEIVKIFQDKIKTNQFMDKNNLNCFPDYLKVEKEDVDFQEVEKFLKSNNWLAFAKPSYPQVGGSKGVGIIRNSRDLIELMSTSPIKGDYMLSEMLREPEYNHTMIINSNGKITAQASYLTTSRKRKIPRNVEFLNNFGNKFSFSLKNNFTKNSFEGTYNADFMRRENGEYVLTEINPGRLPGNFHCLQSKEYNLLEAIIKSTDPNFIYKKKIN